MTFETAQQILLDLPRFALVGEKAYKPGLDRMEALMDAMDRPELAFPSVLVAGTNGKGSTASMLAAIATASGRRTGLHTSPHLQYVGERMRIDGLPADPRWIADRVSRFEGTFSDLKTSFFEATTALSFLLFAENGVDLAIVEVGLGGRLDATNILSAELSVITGIAYDHTAILGSTLEIIATEKAGIIKRNKPVLTGARLPEVLGALRLVADHQKAPFHVLDQEVQVQSAEGGTLHINTPVGEYRNVELGLNGMHQHRNATLAVRAAELCQDLTGMTESTLRKGLSHVRSLSGLRARLEVISETPLIILDVAHNAESLEAGLAYCRSRHNGVDDVYIGLMDDKDAQAIGSLLAHHGVAVRTLHVSSDRGVDPVELAALFRTTGANVVQEGLDVANVMETAYRQGRSAMVTGSHLIAAGILDLTSSSNISHPEATRN